MRSISGITAMLSLRGKIAVRTIVASGAFRRQHGEDSSMPRVMSTTLSSSPGVARDVVGAREHDDDLRVDAVELAVFESPEDVLNSVCAPPEVAAFQP